MNAHRWVLLLLLPYLLWLTFFYQYHFIDGVNLALHEAGHLIFSFGGQVLHFLGGTLGQLVFPLAFIWHFRRQGQFFEACICAMWLGESLMYAAEYMADAQAMRLPLVGGGIHDWHWLFSHWKVLDACQGIGRTVHLIAVAIIAVAWWKAYQLQYTEHDGSPDRS